MMETRRINEIVVGNRFRKDMGDLSLLASSIEQVGLLHAIVVTPKGSLIAGQRRLEACKQLGWKDAPVHTVDLDRVIRGEFAENFVRKDFLPSEAVAIAEALEPRETKAAKERQKEGGRSGGKASGKLPQASESRTRDKVARYTGVSGRTLEKAKAVVEAAKRDPKMFNPILQEMDRTKRVNGAYKKLKRIHDAKKISQELLPLPKGPFRVIVADPPWPYNYRKDDPSHRSANPYPQMAVKDIKEYLAPSLPHQDSILWLWTTNAFIREAFEIIDAWGFTYKTMLTWVKDRMGLGDWLRGKTEHCLLSIKGKPFVKLTNQTTVLNAPSTPHSDKPEAFFELVESLCPGSKVELFARHERQGWITHGLIQR